MTPRRSMLPPETVIEKMPDVLKFMNLVARKFLACILRYPKSQIARSRGFKTRE